MCAFRDSDPRRPSLRSLSVLLSLVLASTGCLTPASVSTEAAADLDFARYRSFVLAPLVVKNEAIDEAAPVATALVDEARSGLEAHGLRATELSAADLLVRLSVDRQMILRRVLSSDPDDNSTVTRPVPQAIVVVDLVDRSSRLVVWRGIGTRRIPNVSIPGLQDEDEMWVNAMARVVGRVPAE